MKNKNPCRSVFRKLQTKIQYDMNWIIQHYEWILGTVLVPIIIALIGKSWNRRKKDKSIANNVISEIESEKDNPINTSSNTNNLTINNNYPGNSPFDSSYNAKQNDSQIDLAKNRIKILFIDDDVKFKVVTILKKAGWMHTKSVKDVSNLDDVNIKEADIFFVDIQGVGKSLEFKDEGLGLSVTLKRKYPNKKLVIYSSESKGDRFHDGLRIADSILSKNAEPYEFQNLVEQFSVDILSSK